MKLLLVDDHPAVLLGLKALLSTEHGIEVVGEASSTEEGVRLAEGLRPDLVVLDLQIGRSMSGIDTCRRLKALETPPRVLVYTGHDSSECLAQAVLAGADGYLHKGATHPKLTEAVRRVRAGERVWAVDVDLEEDASLERKVKAANLTPKESEVLALVLKRYTNGEIARELFVCVPTVKSHLYSIMRKLNVRKRGELFRSPAAS